MSCEIRSKSGQHTIEYAVLIAIVIAALLTMQRFMLAHVEGSWRSALDTLGHGNQYDNPGLFGNFGGTSSTASYDISTTIEDGLVASGGAN